MHLEAPRHILVVKASSLGDILHALPVSAAIKRRFPQTRLTWIVEEKAMGILEGNRCIDELVVCDFSRWKRAPFEGGRYSMKRLRYPGQWASPTGWSTMSPILLRYAPSSSPVSGSMR